MVRNEDDLKNAVSEILTQNTDKVPSDVPFFGSGSVKILMKQQDMIQPTIERLKTNDESLEELCFRFIALTPTHVEALMLGMQSNMFLRKLTFYKSRITKAAADIISAGLEECKGLKELEFYQSKLADENIVALAEGLEKSSSISHFGIYKNDIGIEGLAAIKDAVMNNHNITSLKLFKNQIGTDAASSLAEMLEGSPHLLSLSVGFNNIGDKGVTSIANQLENNTTLTNLSLTCADIGEEGAMVIAQLLRKNSTICSLDLNGNDIADKGSVAISESIISSKTSLSALDLSQNNISEDAVASILRNLNKNTTILSLLLIQSSVSKTTAKVSDLVERNQMLKEHREGIKELGPFFYVTVGKDEEYDDDKITMKWTPQAWEAFSTDGLIVALLHKNVKVLHKFTSNDDGETSADDGSAEIRDGAEILWNDNLRLSLRASLRSFRSSQRSQGTEEDSCFDVNELTNNLLQSLHGKSDVLKRLISECKDENGNTMLARAFAHSTPEAFDFTKFIIHYIKPEMNERELVNESDQTSQCAATIANTVDDTDLWGETTKLILGRYKIENWPNSPMHKSITSRVFFGVDYQVDSWNEYRHVALKFVNKKEDFEKELTHRLGSKSNVTSGEDIIFKDEQNNLQNKNKFNGDFIMPIIRYHEEDLCLVMPLGDRNLDEIIRNEAIAGIDLDSIRILMKSIAISLRYLHEEHKMIHGDIKPRNFVRYNGEMKMIDFYEATPLNEPFESKRSTGYIAPELAKDLFFFRDSRPSSHYVNEEKRIMKQLIKLDRADVNHQEQIQLLGKKLEHVKTEILRAKCVTDVSHEDVVATATLDVWSFGVLSYYLLSGSQLFACDQADNIFAADVVEQQKLLGWNGLSESIESRINSSSENSSLRINVIDLLRRCLHPDRKLRYSNMNQVLNHAFFIDEKLKSSDDEKETDDVMENQPYILNASNSIHSSGNISPMESLSVRSKELSIEAELLKNDQEDDFVSNPELRVTQKRTALDKVRKVMCNCIPV